MTRETPPTAARLLYWIAEHGMTHSEFCTEVGIDPHLLYNWTSGRSVPSLASAVAVERLTGIAASAWIAEGEGPRRRKRARRLPSSGDTSTVPGPRSAQGDDDTNLDVVLEATPRRVVVVGGDE